VAALIQPDGKRLEVLEERLVRTDSSGTPDATFTVSFTPPGAFRSAALQPDGKIIVAGMFETVNRQAVPRIARLLTDGSLDPTFAPGEGPSHDEGYTPAIVSLAVQADGRILVAGSFTHFDRERRDGIARLESDGRLDPSFRPVPLLPSEVKNQPTHILWQPDGKVLVLGWLSLREPAGALELVRLNGDGSVDAGFDLAAPGMVFGPWGLGAGTIQTMALGPDGAFYVGGEFYQLGGFNRAGIVRVNLGLAPLLAIESARMETDGNFMALIRTQPGQSYKVEVSTYLRTWRVVDELPSAGTVTQFRDSPQPSEPVKFYRVRSR
jgi:uncharacterized delta-60 repeat protein